MAYKAGDVINGAWKVEGLCSDSGGMGALLFVTATQGEGPRRVLKYCKETTAEIIQRFRREVRLMTEFKGNGRVIQILDSHLDHDPPYFVMDFFEKGDLTKLGLPLPPDFSAQETLFNQIIDCISELHSRNIYHRDIKPQNFLRTDDGIVVSDFGLCTEIDSPTGFTRSSAYWGTPGYLPPEFFAKGGFKEADAAADIFMLGRTFYVLLSGRDPMYLLPEGVPGPLFAVIERCCVVTKASRYQSLASLRQSLTAAYDVLLHRVIGSALAVRTLRSITDRLRARSDYVPDDVARFIEELQMLDGRDKVQVCLDLPSEIFPILAQKAIQTRHGQFLASYRVMTEDGDYGWSFAEIIADNMKVFFDSGDVSPEHKAEALRIAIIGAVRQNRFAAMDTCRSMITSVVDDELGQRLHDVLLEYPEHFILSIEESNCKAPAIRGALAELKRQAAAATSSAEDGSAFT